MEVIGAIIFYAIIILLIVRKSKKTGVKRPTQPNVQRPAQSVAQMQTQPQLQTRTRSQDRSYPQQKPAQKPAQKQSQLQAQKNSDIVTRAKENAAKQTNDRTQLELELAHGHSHEEEKKPVVHSEVCQTHKNSKVEKLEKEVAAIVPEESLLGSVEDLMIKGYSGNLDFERDFVGEALDMVSNFTINGAHTADIDADKIKKGA